jgi:hypothetical protein
MSEKICTTYNGVVISYDEFDNRWKNEETQRTYETPAKAREAIDRAAKVTNKMDPMPCIIRRSYGSTGGFEFKRGTITSFSDEKTAWITFLESKGKKVREKCSSESYRRSDLYTDTPENWEIIEKLKSLWQKEKDLKNEIEAIQEGMQSIYIDQEYKKLIAKTGEETNG